jgi:hypothetical protein
MTARSVRDPALLDQAGAAARHARWPQRRWAVEGAEGLGRGVAQGLARWWMCRLSWPPGLGCSTRVMLARPTRWTVYLAGLCISVLTLELAARSYAGATGHTALTITP